MVCEGKELLVKADVHLHSGSLPSVRSEAESE